MKKIIATMAALGILFSAAAQEEVVLLDTVQQPYTELCVEAGWEVHLIQNDSPVSTIAIVVPEGELPTAGSTYLSRFSKGKLTIRRNTSLPQGTVVEVCGQLKLKSLNIMENATVVADHYAAVGPKGAGTEIMLADNATLRVRHLEAAETTSIYSSKYAETHIDTISGKSLHVVLQKDDQFHYGENRLSDELKIVENFPHYEKYLPDGLVADKRHAWLLCDADSHLVVQRLHERVWDWSLSLGLLVGHRFGELMPSALASPYATEGTMTAYFPLITHFKLSDKWNLRTGLMMGYEYTKLYHQVTLDEGGLNIADGRTPIQKNAFLNTYLGIPATIYFTPHPKRGSQSVSFGADVRVSRLVGSTFSNMPDIFLGKPLKVREGIYNPWRIEVGLDVATNAIGIIHGVRFYTNLLPEYRIKDTGKSVRAFGLEIIF